MQQEHFFLTYEVTVSLSEAPKNDSLPPLEGLLWGNNFIY